MEKTIFNQKKKIEIVSEEILPGLPQPFEKSNLEDCWLKYAGLLLSEGRMALHTAFLKRMPELKDDFNICFTVDSSAVEKDLNENKTALLSFLRKNLSNYKINLKVDVNINSNDTDHPYTPSEKFKKLAEKNPMINDLKKNLDLEIEY